MQRIEKLTKEQEAMLPVWRDKWIDIGLKTGVTDWETVEKYLPVCYEKANIKYPKNIVRVSSPLVGAFAASIADKIWTKKTNTVDGAVHYAVHDAVSNAVGSAVRDAVHYAVHDTVRGAVSNAVGSAVGDAIDSAVRSAVGSAVGKITWHYWLGGQFWVGGWWGSPSYVSFFTDVCGLKLSKDIQERATAYRMVCESANYIWANRNFVMICARPTKIRRNARGMLHCENGKAIEYPDGWGLYYLNGVKFDEGLYNKVISPDFSFADRMKIVDVDQRTQAINPKFCDIDAFIKEAKGELLDEVNKYDIDGVAVNYKLYKLPKGTIFQEDAYYCYFDCPSTRKKHLEGVEVSKTVAEAMAWSLSNESLGIKVTAEDWSNMIPLIHEN